MSSVSPATLTQKQQYWLGHIQQAKRRNQSFRAYAEDHGLDLKTLYNRHWQLRKKGLLTEEVSDAAFIEVIRPVAAAPQAPTFTLCFPNGIRVEVSTRLDDVAALLKQVQAV